MARYKTRHATECQLLPENPSKTRGSATSAILLLAVAGFASQAMVRSTNSLLPQIAADLNVTVGATSIVVTVYLLAHGSVQLVMGPIGDRFGKYLCVALAATAASMMVALCGLASSLPLLVAARLGSGLATGWIVPLAFAFIGDIIPYARRQQVLGRFLSGQILGQLFGQAASGVLGDHVRLAQRVLHSRRAARGRHARPVLRAVAQSDHPCRATRRRSRAAALSPTIVWCCARRGR